MITIKITNAEQVVLEKKGWFVANVVGAFVDLEEKVEVIVMERIRESLEQAGVKATIERG